MSAFCCGYKWQQASLYANFNFLCLQKHLKISIKCGKMNKLKKIMEKDICDENFEH